MGFFSMNEHSSLYSNYEFPVVEGYNCGSMDCGMAIAEGYQNDLALFTAAVQYDLTEMAAIREGADLEPLQEAGLGGAWESIKEFFRKLGAKIKALFTSFMAKFESYITKDTKAYVKKYEKHINKDYKDFKVKWAEPKNGSYVDNIDFAPAIGTIKFDLDAANTDSKYTSDNYESKDRNEMMEDVWKTVTEGGAKCDNSKDWDEWYHESIYKDEEEKDNWSLSDIRTIADRLSAGTKTLKELDTSYKSANDTIKKIIADIDKFSSKKYGKDEYKPGSNGNYNPNKGETIRSKGYVVTRDANTKKYSYTNDDKNFKSPNPQNFTAGSRIISEVRSKASCLQDIILHMTQFSMKEAKWGVAQDKRIFAKAVAYKAVKNANESAFLDMVEECAEAEVLEYFDSPVLA